LEADQRGVAYFRLAQIYKNRRASSTSSNKLQQSQSILVGLEISFNVPLSELGKYEKAEKFQQL
jgi:hypothetical protein